MRTAVILASMLCLTAPAPTAAYDIRTRIKIGNKTIFYLDDVHESITRLAEQCLPPLGAPRPTRCWTRDRAIADLATSEAGESYSPRELAARWPDDPTRQSAIHTSPKLGYMLKFGCKKRAEGGPSIEKIGLTCSSHFGRLQFMHAMAGPDDRSARDTYDRIIAWARFAYRVASREQDLTQNYCKAFDDPKLSPALRKAFQMEDRSFCSKRTRWLFWSYPAWTVRTLFTLTCSNPLQSKTCREDETDQADEQARLAATGALLHLVQDSFSQAHAHRSVDGSVDERGPFSSRVVCRFPTDYFDYSVQTDGLSEKIHQAADKPPQQIDDTCRDRPQTDDVVTASAAVLWHLAEKKPADTFVQYLTERVFGPRPRA
ncbi:MAG TPA: hypothetical protein VEA61_12970 [Allosphingosinicella sp.]|nr:hypothetical protein [Allosphingosinicella sp.]